jgi:hypothetical protein
VISGSTLRVLRDFWSGFGKLPLYDTGFGDAIAGCSAARAEDTMEAIVAMSYLNGYAQCARLVCPWQGTEWQIANLLSIAAATFVLRLQDDEFSVLQAEKLCHTYTVELAELCRKKADPLFLPVGVEA